MACPLQIFIRNSAIKSFLFSAFLMGYYQYFLSIKNYTYYLLDDRVENRKTFLDANKEGICSCVGYLAIYLCSQSICLRLSSILYGSSSTESNSKGSNVNFKTTFKCILNLIVVVVFFWQVLEWTRTNVQNVSRRLCNLSFICYTVNICSFFFRNSLLK